MLVRLIAFLVEVATGTIIGICVGVIGGALVLGAIALVVIVVFKKKRD